MIAVQMGGNMRFLSVAPSYLSNCTPLISPDDLLRRHCIRQPLPSGGAYRWEFEKHGHEVTIDVPGALLLDQSGLMWKRRLPEWVQLTSPSPSPARRSTTAADHGGGLLPIDTWPPCPTALRAFGDVIKLGSGE